MRSIVVAAMALAFAACSDDMTTPATSFTASLSGQREVPVTTSTATGTATCTATSPTVSCTITYAGLSGAPTSARIYAGAASATSSSATTNVRVYLCGGGGSPACPATAAGTITSGAMAVTGTGVTWQTVVDAMRTYGAYVNVLTAANANGEIRGTIFGVY